MFDLPEVTIKKIGPRVKEDIKVQNTVVFYQTDDCFYHLKESLRFAGMDSPEKKKCIESEIPDALITTPGSFLFIECQGDAAEQANILRHLIPQEVIAVIIGWEDKMSIAREVEKQGFYYLLWPSKKEDTVALLHHINEDRSRTQPVNRARDAMRVGVIGLKGGIGCTLVTAELAYGLAQESQQQVILVDHGFKATNMHIMLGKRNLTLRKMTDAPLSHHSLTNTLDPMTAQSHLAAVDSGIRYLGLESDTMTPDELHDYNHQLISPLSGDANFILEDFSASVKFYPEPEKLCNTLDCLVVVVQPTLSGLHESKQFLEQFRDVNLQELTPSRLIIVLNYNSPEQHITAKTVEEFLGEPVDIQLPYFKKAEEYLTSGKRFTNSSTKLSAPFKELSRKILGKSRGRRSLLSRLFSR